MSLCHATRSSSRSAALTSESTSSVCGIPRSRKEDFCTIHRVDACGGIQRDEFIVRGREQVIEMQRGRVLADGRSRSQVEGALCCPVDQAQRAIRSEGEHRRLHSAHHALEQRHGLDRAGAPPLQGAGERVHLNGEIAYSIVSPAAACAEGKIIFAQGLRSRWRASAAGARSAP